MAEPIDGQSKLQAESERRDGQAIATETVRGWGKFLASKLAEYQTEDVGGEIFRVSAIFRNTLIAECEKLLGPQDRWK